MVGRKIKSIICGIALFIMFSAVIGWAQDNFFMDNPATFNKFRVAKTYMYKGRQLFLKGKYQKAEKAFNRCLRDFNRFADAYYYLALIYSGRKNYPQALQYIKKADANFLFMDDLEVKARLRAGGFSKLDHVYRLNRARRRASYSVCYGNILVKLNKLAEAEPHFRVGVKENPKNGPAYHNLITLLTILKKYNHAIHQLKDAEFQGHKIAANLRGRVVKNVVTQAKKQYQDRHYSEAYYLLKVVEGYQNTVDPLLAKSIDDAFKQSARELSAEAHSLLSQIVSLYNDRKYLGAWRKINLAEDKGLRISETMKNIVRKQLKREF